MGSALHMTLPPLLRFTNIDQGDLASLELLGQFMDVNFFNFFFESPEQLITRDVTHAFPLIYRPPAIAGTIETSSLSLKGVSLPRKVRISSPLTKTLT